MTTDASKRRVRVTAIAATGLVGVGAAVAIGANPYPHSERPKDADVRALETREMALAREARSVNALNADRWAAYRVQLAQRINDIAAIKAANARTLAAASSSTSYGGISSGSSASTSSSGQGGGYAAAPAATYVPAPPVTRSGSS